MTHKCHLCTKTFPREDHLKRHIKGHINPQEYRCELCNSSFNRKDNLVGHRKRVHAGSRAVREPKLWRPWETEPTTSNAIHTDQNLDSSFSESELDDSEAIQQLVDKYSELIVTKSVKSKRTQDRYNFQTDSPDLNTLRQYVEQIYQDQTHPFKLNISFGFILRHTTSKQLTFYYASNNNKLFEKPILVSSFSDIDTVVEKVDEEDLLEYCRQQRPNSSFVVVTITNILFYVDKIRQFRIGCPVQLPDFVKNNRGVLGLDRDQGGVPYTDNLCLFRCLSLHRKVTNQEFARSTTNLFLLWCRSTGTNPTTFSGIKDGDLSLFEQIFNVPIEVYELVDSSTEPDDTESDDELNEGIGNTVYARQIRRSTKQTDSPTLNVNLYSNHFSFIKDLKLYCRKWSCEKCRKLFSYHSRCLQHQQSCIGGVRLRFRAGGFGLTPTIFHELVKYGIYIEPGDEFYFYRISYDFEALIKNLNPDISFRKGSCKVLTPASVSVCSNVPGFESPKCFVVDSKGETDIMDCFIKYISLISDKAFELVSHDLQYVTDSLNEKIDRFEQLKSLGQQASREETEEKERLQIFVSLKEKFVSWMRKIVVLGFNSGKFDLNLIRSYLFPYMLEKNIPVSQIIKRGSSYLCISTDKCLFLDMRNYLSPSVSYEKWIKSLNIPQNKGFFPYEWLTDISKLSTPYLVSKDNFYSTLKQRGISDAEYSGLQKVWTDQNFQTMRDLLVWYNNLDTEPFIKAADKFFQHWKGLGIDPFKSGSISLPGLALTHLMRTMPKHVVLPLIPEKYKGIFFCIRDNIVGGLSNVFHRYHEVGVTKLPNGMPTASIVSRDANGLYLYRLGQPTGTGIIQIWRTSNTSVSYRVSHPDMNKVEISAWKASQSANMSALFRRQSMYPMCEKELEWLEWYSHCNSVSVQHKFNGGQMVIKKNKSVKYPVDGYVSSTNTVLQFHGCYWHGHECNPRHLVNQERRISTEEVTMNLRALGYVVVEMWECAWNRQKEFDPAIIPFLNEHVSIPNLASVLSAEEIILGIKDGDLFGLIECSLEVPRFNPTLNKHFHEFPPIFKNAYISIDDCGPYMRAHAQRFGLMKKPRRNLISSYHGEKLLIPSDLLMWYLKNNLEVTRVYQFLQMKPKRCFQHLVDEVTFHRRAADADPSLAPIGSAYKDQGNQYYGKTATDKLKHKNVQLCPDSSVDRFVNDKRFCAMEEVGDAAYEIQMDKRRITLDLPLTVAFFVYGGSKLTMLSFVYDFLKRYLIPGSYQIVNMDTDSIIAAYASKNIEELVKPELRREFEEEGKKNFLVNDADSLRTPGLFKVELTADGIIALCAKTYFAWSEDMTKAVSKGLSKVTNNLNRADYMNVVDTGLPGGGTNHGFRTDGPYLVQYSQFRRSLSNLFIKRKVRSDGISTDPLDQ